MIGDSPRGQQILVQQRRRHRQRLAGVVEAGLVGGIDGEFPRRTDVDAGQIADRVVVLGIAEPSREHHAGIAVTAAGLGGPGRLNPLDHLLPRAIGRLGRLFRRHLARAEPRENAIPARKILDDGIDRRVLRQIELCGRPGAAVAARAVGLEERLHGFREHARRVRDFRRGRLHRGGDAPEEEKPGEREASRHG